MYSRTGKGFTLIELMVVIAIVAILASIAYPAYMQYAKKGIRTQAATYLTYLGFESQNYLLVWREYPETWEEMKTEFTWDENIGDTSYNEIVTRHYQFPPTLEVVNVNSVTNQNGPPRFKITLIPNSPMMAGDGHMCIRNIGGVMIDCETANPVDWQTK